MSFQEVVEAEGRLIDSRLMENIFDTVVEQHGRFEVEELRLETFEWERWFTRRELEGLLKRHCHQVESREISYWEDVPPDGLFLAWPAVK